MFIVWSPVILIWIINVSQPTLFIILWITYLFGILLMCLQTLHSQIVKFQCLHSLEGETTSCVNFSVTKSHGEKPEHSPIWKSKQRRSAAQCRAVREPMRSISSASLCSWNFWGEMPMFQGTPSWLRGTHKFESSWPSECKHYWALGNV